MHIDPILALKSLITGAIVGAVFAFLKLPIPAPGIFEGIIGIFGILLGAVLVQMFIH